MKIGFIGAGKVGFTLGKHMVEFVKNHGSVFETKERKLTISNEICVMGFYSRSLEHAKEAARFTDTNYYESMNALVQACDTIFLTVPDGQIDVIAKELDVRGEDLDGKILIHASGALSSQVFSGMDSQVYGYSIHPIYAVNSRTASYIHFQDCFITVEGAERYASFLMDFFRSLGHPVKRINALDKVQYHAAAVFASNLVVGLYNISSKLLSECGFTMEEAEKALAPLFLNNAENLVEVGCHKAMTGPVARCDIGTVRKHLQTLKERDALDADCVFNIYRELSRNLVSIARDNQAQEALKYDELEKTLDEVTPTEQT